MNTKNLMRKHFQKKKASNHTSSSKEDGSSPIAVPTVPISRNSRSGLTFKQQRFAEEYLVDLNATKAAIRSGYSIKNADKIGSRLVGKSRVLTEIQRLMDIRSSETKIRAADVLEDLKIIALSSPFDFVTINPATQEFALRIEGFADPAHIKALRDIEISPTVKRIAMQDKVAAIGLLLKHINISI